jgi:broad specificity phosphatase PhoE
VRRALLAFALAAMALLPALAEADVLVVVVRHAEKATDDPRDPDLDPAGQARARALAAALAGSRLDVVYATQFKRTRQTAAPAAGAAGVEVTVRPIDGGNAPAYAADLARDLRALPAGSVALVVGHSNTVPGIVAALDGRAEAAMPETEYDRFTTVRLRADGGADTVVSRY